LLHYEKYSLHLNLSFSGCVSSKGISSDSRVETDVLKIGSETSKTIPAKRKSPYADLDQKPKTKFRFETNQKLQLLIKANQTCKLTNFIKSQIAFSYITVVSYKLHKYSNSFLIFKIIR
jgi:hypothetical protein